MACKAPGGSKKKYIYYKCDSLSLIHISCGYRTNDDRAGAMNIHYLGRMYAAGDPEPKFVLPKPALAAADASGPGEAKLA